MLLKYTGQNIHSFPTDPLAKSIITLKPGINEFPTPVWIQFKKHPIVMGMIENGLIELVTAELSVKKGKKTMVIGKEGDDKEVRLKDLIVPDAVKFSKETFDLDVLEKWLAEETRVKVKKSLETQIKKINSHGSEE